MRMIETDCDLSRHTGVACSSSEASMDSGARIKEVDVLVSLATSSSLIFGFQELESHNAENEEVISEEEMLLIQLEVDMDERVQHLKAFQLRGLPEIAFENPMSRNVLEEVAKVWTMEEDVDELTYVKGVVVAQDPVDDSKVQETREKLFEDYSNSVFKESLGTQPPSRGPLGEAKIEIMPGRSAVKQRPFGLAGDRRQGLIDVINKLKEEDKIEEGYSPWSNPAFVVPKKTPGDWRLVIDYRKLNDATVVDGHPLPRIEDILQRQGKNKIWTVFDLKDGFHQIPMHPESKHYTCISTPIRTYQWKVMPMGLKNAPSIFQRVMDWVFKDMGNVYNYIDDINIGSTGETTEEMLENHERDVHTALDKLAEHTLLASKKKAQLFVLQGEF